MDEGTTASETGSSNSSKNGSKNNSVFRKLKTIDVRNKKRDISIQQLPCI